MSMTVPGYRAASEGVGWIDRSDRVRLDLTGPDRAKFLHNLVTNDVKRLPVGLGCEAFVTSPQGKTLGYVSLLAADDRILLRTDPGGLGPLLPHFRKYGAFDEVAWDDAGPSTFEYHLVGPRAGDLLLAMGGDLPPEADLGHAMTTAGGRAVRVVRESPTGRPGLTLIGALADGERVAEALLEAGGPLGLVACDPATFEALRIEAGTPANGRDVTPDNLPQEIGRDDRAINFVKGCYLGQETVARLDALGHVNKILKGARMGEGSDVPPAGTGLEVDGKRVGTVTSAAFSPGWDRPVLLALIRMAHARAGAELAVALDGDRRPFAVVADLPMLPPDQASSRS